MLGIMYEVMRFDPGRYKVVCGIISPVHDDYKKKDLVSSKHRFAMCKLAAEVRNKIFVGFLWWLKLV